MFYRARRYIDRAFSVYCNESQHLPDCSKYIISLYLILSYLKYISCIRTLRYSLNVIFQ